MRTGDRIERKDANKLTCTYVMVCFTTLLSAFERGMSGVKKQGMGERQVREAPDYEEK